MKASFTLTMSLDLAMRIQEQMIRNGTENQTKFITTAIEDYLDRADALRPKPPLDFSENPTR